MNAIIKPITPDGNTGFDKFGQLFSFNVKENDGYFIHDVRDKFCPICNKGWINTTEALQDQIFINRTEKYYHKTCFYGHLNLSEHNFIYNLALQLNPQIPGFTIKEIPNQYSNIDKINWYELIFVAYPNNKIVIGWRKRVRHIELFGMNNRNIMCLFIDEKVTQSPNKIKDSFTIHAWSDEKTKEYIKKMMDWLKNK